MLTSYGADLYAGLLVGETVVPAELWLGFFDIQPDSSDTGSTVSEPGALRFEVTPGVGTWSVDPFTGIAYLTSGMTFTPATDWGTMGFFGVLDAPTLGNLIQYGSFAPRAFLAGRLVSIPANSISIKAVI